MVKDMIVIQKVIDNLVSVKALVDSKLSNLRVESVYSPEDSKILLDFNADNLEALFLNKFLEQKPFVFDFKKINTENKFFNLCADIITETILRPEFLEYTVVYVNIVDSDTPEFLFRLSNGFEIRLPHDDRHYIMRKISDRCFVKTKSFFNDLGFRVHNFESRGLQIMRVEFLESNYNEFN